jgi:hypothetical protein
MFETVHKQLGRTECCNTLRSKISNLATLRSWSKIFSHVLYDMLADSVQLLTIWYFGNKWSMQDFKPLLQMLS